MLKARMHWRNNKVTFLISIRQETRLEAEYNTVWRI